MTQLESARKGITTSEMCSAAAYDGADPEVMRRTIADGFAVLPANKKRRRNLYCAIGKNLSVKINVNIGTSPKNESGDSEMEKIRISAELGAESIMDLSVSGNLDKMRAKVLKAAPMMVGTVPIYQCMHESKLNVMALSGDDIIGAVRRHAEAGVDFITVHCGVTQKSIPASKDRLMGIVSRGGSFIVKWMKAHEKENPLFERYDELLEIARKYDVTLSLGDAMRPGALADAGDDAQYGELSTLGELAGRARDAGVQVMIEGPGHVSLDAIKGQIEKAGELCGGSPLYVLGPLVTDRAPGYDHIAGAIGGAFAGYCGASFLCFLTPAEHLRHPSIQDTREGIIASKIAAHAADIARGNPRAIERNRRFSKMRRDFDWDGMFANAIDPCKPRMYRETSSHSSEKECSMCGEFCAMKSEDLQ